MPNPSTGILNKQYVSALSSFIDTREINKNVTDVYNENHLTDILDLGSRKKPIATGQPFYNTFINNQIFVLLEIASSTGSGSVQGTITCTAATSGYVRTDDILLAPNGVISLIVTQVVSASGVDTISWKSVAGVNSTLTNGDKLSIISMAVGENSVSQTNLRYGLTRYYNKYQIFREISVVTDVQTAATIETTFNGQPYYAVKDHIDKTIKLKGSINAQFIAGDMSTTSFADTTPFLVDPNTSNGNGGGAQQTTMGLHKYNQYYGSTIVNGTLGVYQQANLNDVVQTLIANRAPKDQLVFGSSVAKTVTDTYYKNLGSAGVTSVRLVVDGRETDMEVDKVKYGGFTFNYMAMPIMDHPVLLNQTVITKSLYYIPYNDKVPVYGGGYDTCVGVRYIPSQTKYGNGMIDEIHTGALAWVNPNGDALNATTSWTTKQGLEVLGAQFLLREQVL